MPVCPGRTGFLELGAFDTNPAVPSKLLPWTLANLLLLDRCCGWVFCLFWKERRCSNIRRLSLLACVREGKLMPVAGGPGVVPRDPAGRPTASHGPPRNSPHSPASVPTPGPGGHGAPGPCAGEGSDSLQPPGWRLASEGGLRKRWSLTTEITVTQGGWDAVLLNGELSHLSQVLQRPRAVQVQPGAAEPLEQAVWMVAPSQPGRGVSVGAGCQSPGVVWAVDCQHTGVA